MQIQVQKEMQKESAKHAGYKAKVPLRGVAVKKKPPLKWSFNGLKNNFSSIFGAGFGCHQIQAIPSGKCIQTKKEKQQ